MKSAEQRTIDIQQLRQLAKQIGVATVNNIKMPAPGAVTGSVERTEMDQSAEVWANRSINLAKLLLAKLPEESDGSSTTAETAPKVKAIGKGRQRATEE